MKPVVFDRIAECARCGGDHEGPFIAKPFRKPLLEHTHWTTCPTTGDPVLVAVEETE